MIMFASGAIFFQHRNCASHCPTADVSMRTLVLKIQLLLRPDVGYTFKIMFQLELPLLDRENDCPMRDQ